jgi:predicted metallopeptidase
MFRLCADIARRMPAFRHLRMEQVAVTFAQARRSVSYGLQAKLTPMRFQGGTLTTVRHGKKWTVQRLFDGEGREMLYILTFYLPRFQNHPFREKLVTVFHELYHIGPKFDGDLRRFGGRYHVHSHSQTEYDRLCEEFTDEYMARRPPERVVGFLHSRFAALERRHGAVVGLKVPIPKLIPLTDARKSPA